MKNDYVKKILTLIIFILSCEFAISQTVTKQYAIGELGWTEEEYSDHLQHINDKPNSAVTKKLTNNQTNVIEENDIVKPIIFTCPLIPYVIIKEEDYENTK